MASELIAGVRRVGIDITGQSVKAGPTLRSDHQAQETSSAAHIATLAAEVHDLRAQLDQVRAERNRLADLQRRVMELLKVQSADRLLHDIRNVLNERELLRALTAEM